MSRMKLLRSDMKPMYRRQHTNAGNEYYIRANVYGEGESARLVFTAMLEPQCEELYKLGYQLHEADQLTDITLGFIKEANKFIDRLFDGKSRVEMELFKIGFSSNG